MPLTNVAYVQPSYVCECGQHFERVSKGKPPGDTAPALYICRHCDKWIELPAYCRVYLDA